MISMGTLISITKTGCVNDDTALEWLQHFIDHTRNERRGAWLLLIIDGYGSHMTIPFHNLATENKIVLFRLPPHSSHLTQLLDVGGFQPFKHYHTDAIDKGGRLRDEKFGKLEFLAAFQSFGYQTFKPTTIRHVFKSPGLVPFDPDAVLDKIREKQAQKAETALQTPSPPPFPSHQRTPQAPASIVKYGQQLQRAYANLKPREKIDSQQRKRFIRGPIASAHTLELTARDSKAIQEATTARAKRASLGGQVAQQGGTKKVGECRALCSNRKEKEEEQARKRKEREEKRAKKQANSKLAQIWFLFGGVPHVEWYLSYNLSPQSSNYKVVWWCGDFFEG